MCEPLTLELYALIPAYLKQTQVCCHCGLAFKECDNIGRHLCHIHPGIRLVDGNERNAFYSCCKLPERADGCLQADHISCALSVTDAKERLWQISQFNTIVIPHLLIRFITRPLVNSILYDSKKCGRKGLFRYQFDLIKLLDESSVSLSINYPAKIIGWEKPFVLCPEDDLSVKEFDLMVESDAIFKMSEESPLFKRLLSQESDKKRKIVAQCENVWRSQLNSREDDVVGVDNVYCANTEVPDIPFLIISRINDRLG